MKKSIALCTAAVLTMFATTLVAQTTFKEMKAGHEFHVSIPDYMNRTLELNNSASIQFKSEVKDIYGFIIEDTKEDLGLAEINFSSVSEFYTSFITDFLKDEKKRSVSAPVSKTVGTTHFIECDFSYYDKDAKAEIYYLIGIVETPTSFYKVLCWSTVENKGKYKADFQKIVYSLKD